MKQRVEGFGRRLPYFLVSLMVIALDRFTKTLVGSALSNRSSVQVIPDLFDLTYVENPGGVFGVFKQLDANARSVLFTVVPVTAIVLIAAYAHRIPAARRVTQVALSLILGGALGNLIDRLSYGYVIDFLDFYWRGHHWPAFNVADSAICVGVAVLMFETLLAREGASPVESGPPPAEVPRRNAP